MNDRKAHPVLKTLRRFPRHQQLSELSLTYEGSNEILRIYPPNLSTKGMFINTGVAFPEGSVLKLSFRLARTGAKIVTRCEVRYCLPAAGLGVEFVELSRESARAIETELGMTRRQPKGAKSRQKQSK
jgi:Tfp pilus assembly protein PilZ